MKMDPNRNIFLDLNSLQVLLRLLKQAIDSYEQISQQKQVRPYPSHSNNRIKIGLFMSADLSLLLSLS